MYGACRCCGVGRFVDNNESASAFVELVGIDGKRLARANVNASELVQMQFLDLMLFAWCVDVEAAGDRLDDRASCSGSALDQPAT